MHGGDDLPEEMPGIMLAERLLLADVVIQVTPAGVLHDDHNLAAVLEHWTEQGGNVRPLQCALLGSYTHSSLVPNQTGPPSRDICYWAARWPGAAEGRSKPSTSSCRGELRSRELAHSSSPWKFGLLRIFKTMLQIPRKAEKHQ